MSVDVELMTPPKRSQAAAKRVSLPQYDQELLAAKNSGKTVEFCMVVECPYTNSDGIVQGTVLYVDKFNVKIEVPHFGAIWFSKLHIMGTKVFHA